MVRVAVVGATGFTGEQIVEIIATHPEAQLTYLTSRVEKPTPYADLYPRHAGTVDLNLENLDADQVIERADVVFLSLPHTVSFQFAPLFVKNGKTVIDLSADYRLRDPKMYEKFYKVVHTDTENVKNAVYGLPELNREKIKASKFIANPGCYPTVSTLALLPLVKAGLVDNIIIDAISGISGAGRSAKIEHHYVHLNENLYAYKVFAHQHVPEIEQTLSDVAGKKQEIIFTPHVVGFERGIYATIYADLAKDFLPEDVWAFYENMYRNEPFIRLRKKAMPQLADVRHTNFCDIGIAVKGRKIVICACIDNLMKGAASQAVQNMNIIHGLGETTGLM